eukprot:m.171147 g.171147  ORF g.171147 m.171147 type:complete len:373 (+) comp31635_c1_seq7:493-1611(+)
MMLRLTVLVLLLSTLPPCCHTRVAVPATPPALSYDDSNQMNTAVVLAAIGRTGSTLLSRLFSVLDGVFLIVEPYKNFLIINSSDRQRKRLPSLPQPPLASLLDCSFAKRPITLNEMKWTFLCMHSRLVAPEFHEAFKKKCISEEPFNENDTRLVLDHCLQSKIRIVKTIRLNYISPKALTSLTTLESKPNFVVRVLHVIRHPFKVLASQYNQGWHQPLRFRSCLEHLSCNISHEPTTLDQAQILRASAHLTVLGREVCQVMANTTTKIRKTLRLPGSSAVLRYEDLVPPNTLSVLKGITRMLQIEDALKLQKVLVRLKDTSERIHAGFRVTGQDIREVHTRAAQDFGETQADMAQAHECKDLYHTFNYAPWP